MPQLTLIITHCDSLSMDVSWHIANIQRYRLVVEL